MLTRLRLHLRQFWCGFEHGHTTELAMERGRQFLRCVSCGWESEGISISATHPKARWVKYLRFQRRLKAERS